MKVKSHGLSRRLSNGLILLYIICLFLYTTKSDSSFSDLCYLSDGASSQTFTVNEALPINSSIGTLQVIGNVSNKQEVGNIELSIALNHPNNRLDGQEVPIRLESGSKNIILTRQLDKEGVEGENGVVIEIKCQKKLVTSDPSVIIPVRIIVTDANDNSPQFIGTPYVINVSEVTVIGSTLVPNAKVFALDEDQQGPFSTVEYYIEPGPFSHLIQFESRLSGNLILTSALDYETLPKFWVVIRAQDQGEPPNTATTTLSVIVQDADDQNPRFLDDKYTSILSDTFKENQLLTIKPRAIRAIDPDKQINSQIQYSFNSPESSREYSYFIIDPKFGTIKLKRPLPVSINLPITLVIKAVQTDNRDRYALTTLTILSNKQPEFAEIRFLKSNYTASVFENAPIGHTLLTVQTTRLSDESYKLSSLSKSSLIKYQILDDDENYFGIRNNGEIIVKKSLDYETKQWHSFRVMASDGKQSDVTRVYISLINVNDHNPQFSQVHYNFWVNDDNRQRSRSYVGQIKATDNDVDDKLSFTIKGPFSNVFSISAQGLLRIKNLTKLNTTQCHLIVVATDNGSPPRSSSVPVTVQFSPSALRNLGRSFEIENESFFNDLDNDSSELHNSGISINSIFNATGYSAVILVIVLGALLATLFIIIITLTVNVLKHKKIFDSSSGLSSSFNDSSSASTDVSPNSNHTKSKLSITSFKKNNKVGVLPEDKSFFDAKLANLTNHGVENPIFNIPNTVTSNLISRYYSNPINQCSNRSDPDSAIASDASSNETLTISLNRREDLKGHDETRDHQDRSLTPPPPPPSITCVSSSSSEKITNTFHSETMKRGNTSKISVFKWPQGSIPRRVKKLTWEDEKFGYNSIINSPNSEKSKSNRCEKLETIPKAFNDHSNITLIPSKDNYYSNHETKIELDPEVSVAPFPRTFHHHNVNSNLPDLTVYF